MNSRIPDSLLHTGLQPVWEAARNRLDRFGLQRRGTIVLPKLDQKSILALESLTGGKLGKRLDLTDLEESLSALKVADDLSSALTRLGYSPSQEAARRRTARAQSQAARTALTRVAVSWPEPWAEAWTESVVSSGLLSNLDSQEVQTLVADMRRLLDHLDRAEPHLDQVKPPSISRTELAAILYGSAHALDTGTKRAAFAAHALRHMLSAAHHHTLRANHHTPSTAKPDERAGCDLAEENEDCDGTPADPNMLEQRELWEAVGILSDRVSAPALTWRLPVIGVSPLDDQVRAASAGSLPVHVSLFALLHHPVTVPLLTHVLMVENPRLVEAAAERSLPVGVITSNGNPSTAVSTLLKQLLRSGASVWYHGDFDAPGIRMCRRMQENGCKPWMMDADDYANAIRLAEHTGARLDADTHDDCGATPWDPVLRDAFNDHRLIVHEESILDSVLNSFHSHSTDCVRL